MGFLVVTAMAIMRVFGWGFVYPGKEIRDGVTFIKSETTGFWRDILQASVAKLKLSVANKTDASTNEELAMDQAL